MKNLWPARHRALLPLVLAGFLAVVSSTRAESILPSPSFQPGSGIEMRIINFYDEIPPSGFLPMRVEVKNKSNGKRAWQLHMVHSQSENQTMQSSFPLEVEANSERMFDILVPLSPQANASSRYSNLSVNVSGYAVTDGSTNEHSSSGGGGTSTPFLGLGEALSVKNWGALREQFEKNLKKTLDGTAVDPALLPSDWRGLAGFEVFMFTDAEWRRIPAAQRTALREWIGQGGRLVLFHADEVAPPDLPKAGDLGAGVIVHQPLRENILELIVKSLVAPLTPISTEAMQNYTWQWQMASEVGRAEPPQILIISFVIVFAVVIGPLNFLVFAPSGRRHRLFWTTPLISLVATLLMGTFIAASEGLGGSGQRFEAQLVLASDQKAVLWQEQVSRTGVLTSSAFSLSEPGVLYPIRFRRGNTNTHYMRPNSESRSYSLDGSRWGGDWFRSRTTQAQFVSSIIPSRGKLQVSSEPDGTPTAISSFEHDLATVWYFDASGKAWKGTGLRPGEKLRLKQADQPEFSKWWNHALVPAGPAIHSRASAYAKGPLAGKFFASTATPKSISSLPSIRWKDREGLLFGQAAQ